LDKDVDQCQPKFNFVRTDPASQFSSGFNYRYAVYDGPDTRDQFKVSGLRIFFSVSGVAGRWAFVPMALTFGAGIYIQPVQSYLGLLLLSTELIFGFTSLQ
jgi:hypothetical protein